MTRRLTKRDLARLSEEYRLYNKQMKQSNNRKLCFASLEDYLDWRFGRTTASSSVRSSTRTMQPTRSYERATRAQEIPSLLHKELPSDLKNATAKPDGNSYSGTYLSGTRLVTKLIKSCVYILSSLVYNGLNKWEKGTTS